MNILISPYPQKLRNGKRSAKDYPYWKELIVLLKKHNITQLAVPGEVQLVPNMQVNLGYDTIKRMIHLSDFWISVDSFLQHVAHHVKKPGVVLWGPSDPLIFGYEENLNILKDRSVLRKDQYEIWEKQEFNPDIFVKPEQVYESVKTRFSL